MLALILSASAHASDINEFIDLMTASWRSAPTTFSTTYSPCLDGLVVNFRINGCKVIAQNPERLGEDTVGLVCVDPEIRNGWTTIEHVIIPTQSVNMQEFSGWDFLCADPNITMYIPEPPPRKSSPSRAPSNMSPRPS